MDLSPPAEWRPATLTLSPAPSGAGLEGCLTITDPEQPEGHRTFRIHGWRKAGATDGVTSVVFNISLRGPDPWLDQWLARIASKVQGG